MPFTHEVNDPEANEAVPSDTLVPAIAAVEVTAPHPIVPAELILPLTCSMANPHAKSPVEVMAPHPIECVLSVFSQKSGEPLGGNFDRIGPIFEGRTRFCPDEPEFWGKVC